MILVAALALPATIRAQDTGRGFLFGTPVGSLTLSGGWAGARANSDLFAFTTNNLTVNRSDFSSPTFGADLAVRLHGRTQLMFSVDAASMNKSSEFRHFIDNNDQPIEQTTSFRRVPLAVSVKQYLTTPGRSIGRLAWVPSRAAVYVGAGGGAQYYQFKQSGDFVDFEDPNMAVFSDEYVSKGWAPMGQALAGVDYTLSPRFALTVEGRYVWSNAALSRDFSGFQRLDLSGFATTAGITLRF
jgi:hypothetical protein